MTRQPRVKYEAWQILRINPMMKFPAEAAAFLIRFWNRFCSLLVRWAFDVFKVQQISLSNIEFGRGESFYFLSINDINFGHVSSLFDTSPFNVSIRKFVRFEKGRMNDSPRRAGWRVAAQGTYFFLGLRPELVPLQGGCKSSQKGNEMLS